MTPTKLRSLGFHTDLLIFEAMGARLERRDGRTLVITDDNPTFRWGNMIIYDTAPNPGVLPSWEADYQAIIAAGRPQIDFFTFGWDDPRGAVGDVDAFTEAGYEVEKLVVLGARALRPPAHHNSALSVRPLRSDRDWEDALDLQTAHSHPDDSSDESRAFMQWFLERQRAMAARGQGERFGAWLGDTLVGELGVFCLQGYGRFQSVITHPKHRRQGVCQTLTYEAGCWALRQDGAEQLIIVAEEGSQAEGIYRRLGFELIERQGCAMLRRKSTSPEQP